MYNIDSNYLSNREDIKNAYDSCVVHANALIEFYQHINASLTIGSDAFNNGKLTDDAKYMIYYCREQLQAIPVEMTQMRNLEDRNILALVMNLKHHCSEEIKDLINFRDILIEENPTPAHAAMQFFSLKYIKKNHIAKLAHYYDLEIDHVKNKNKNNKVPLKNYSRMMRGNSITHFFDDVITLLKPCLDDVKDKYEELVDYGTVKMTSGESDFSYVFKVNQVSFKPLLNVFNGFHTEYQSLKGFLQLHENIFSDSQVNAYFENIESHVRKNEVDSAVAEINQNLNIIHPDKAVAYSFDIIRVFSAIMKMSNILEQAVAVLRKQKEYIDYQMAHVQVPVVESLEAVYAEFKPQVATIHHVALAIEQPPIATPELAPAIEQPLVATPELAPAVDAESDIETNFDRSIQERQRFAVKQRKTSKEYQDENLTKVKDFDREVLALFFKTPAPHFKMTEKDYVKFMRSIGASVNESTGNGSSVKITLDPKSVLIAPGENLSSTAMNMHKQHQSGHSVKTIPAFVIKNSLEFFKRAGLYEYLYEENQKYLHPSAVKNNSACTM